MHCSLPASRSPAGAANPAQVYDIFVGSSGAVLNKTEVLTIGVPEAQYSLGSGQQVECRLVYSTLDLQISYTFVTTLLFDADGNTSVVMPLTGGWLGGWVAGWLGGWVDGWMGGWVAKHAEAMC